MMGRSAPEFHVNFGSGRIGHFSSGSGWVASRKLDPRPILIRTVNDYHYSNINYRSNINYAGEDKNIKLRR